MSIAVSFPARFLREDYGVDKVPYKSPDENLCGFFRRMITKKQIGGAVGIKQSYSCSQNRK